MYLPRCRTSTLSMILFIDRMRAYYFRVRYISEFKNKLIFLLGLSALILRKHFVYREIVDQIWAILPLSTLTTFFYSSFSPFALWLNAHSWSSGILCPLQNTKVHLHSIPSKPTFFLQVKHLFLSTWTTSTFSSFFSSSFYSTLASGTY